MRNDIHLSHLSDPHGKLHAISFELCLLMKSTVGVIKCNVQCLYLQNVLISNKID